MGNVLNLPTEGDSALVESKDIEVLELPASSVFNDEYVSSVFDALPVLDDEVIDTESPDTALFDSNLLRIIGTLTNSKAQMSTDLESFKYLDINNDFIKSESTKSSQKRARLLLRIHQAYQRFAKTHEDASDAQAAKTDIISQQSSESIAAKAKEDPQAVLAAMNASMCLSIAKTVGKSFPEVATNLSNSLIDMLKGLGPNSMRGSNSASLLKTTMESIYSYARELESSSQHELRSVALGLMLVVASAVGSVEYLLGVIDALSRGVETLHPSVLCIFEDLNSIKTELLLSVPNSKSAIEKFAFDTELRKPFVPELITLNSSSIAFDGTHLIVWDPADLCIRRIGSGLGGTIKGAEMQVFTTVLSQIEEYTKVKRIDSKYVYASICCLEKQLYFSCTEVLGSGKVAVFNVRSMTLESVRSIAFQGALLSSTIPSDASVKEVTFTFDHEEVVDIRASAGYSMRVKSATYHETDCTETISDLVSKSDRYIHFGDIVALLGDPAPGMPKQLVIVLECLPIGNTNKFSDIQLVSAYYHESNYEGDNVIESIKTNFDAFSARWLPGVTSTTIVNTLGLPYVSGDSPKSLWVNCKLASESDDEIQTISFEENGALDWGKLASQFNVEVSFAEHKVHSAIASDGRYIVALDSRTISEPSNQQVLFNCLRDVSISSAYFYDTNYCGSDISSVVRTAFIDYLNNASEFPTINTSWLTDFQPNVKKTLWINVLIGSSTKQYTLAFEEYEKLDFEVILKLAYTIFSGYDTQLDVLLVDPLHEMKVARSCEIPVPSSLYADEKALNSNTNIISNGQKLILHQLQIGGRTDAQAKLQVFGFDICGANAILLSNGTEEYLSSNAIASGFCYDASSNYIWGWDLVNSKFMRWRNAGLRPKKSGFEKAPTVISASPSARLAILWPDKTTESLSVASSQVQASVLCSLLDKLSEPYAPFHAGSSNEVYPSNEIELISKGASSNTMGYSTIKVRGKTHGLGEKPDQGEGRGYNIVTLSDNFDFEEYRNFDTTQGGSAVDAMSDYINGLPVGKLVLVATNTNAVSNMNLRSFNALRSIGADTAGLERNLSSNILNEAYAVIGRKGSKPGTAIQKVGKESKQVTCRSRIPSCDVPLAVELSKTNINSSVTALVNHHKLWNEGVKSGSISSSETVIVISLLHVVTVTIHQLLSGVNEKRALALFGETTIAELRSVLAALIDNTSTDPAVTEVSKAALRLFIESLNLLYPTTAERQVLLLNYLKQYVRNELSSQESKILQLLLGRVSSPKELVPIVHSDDANAVTDLLACLMTIMKTDLPKQLAAMISSRSNEDSSSSSSAEASGSLFEASVSLISTLSKMLLSRITQEIVLATENQSVESEVRGKRSGYTFISMVTTMIDSCNDVLTEILAANTKLTEGSRNILDPEIEDLIHSSLIGSLLPFFFSSISIAFKSHGTRLLQWVDSNLTSNLQASLVKILKQIQFMESSLPSKAVYKSNAPVVRKVEKVFECAHPYDNNMDTTTEISIPGAKKLVIIFDPASRTENGCDYLRFVDNSGNSLHPTIEKFCGRDGSQNWPGCEGRPELELECNQCKMLFHSDGSVTDWGYKFTVIGQLASSSSDTHWLVTMDELIVQCMTSVAISCFSSVPWNEALEEPLQAWMNDSIIQPELFQGKPGASEEDMFLLGLVDRPAGSLAETFVGIMKKAVREDQGSDETINKSVYATCAALIKLNNLSAEALAIAKKNRRDISSAMIKAWTSGQKMRSFFDLADAQVRSNNHDAANQPSLYAGANADVLEAASHDVVARAQFLMRSAIEEEEEVVPSSPRSKPTGIVRSASYLAKQRWGLLAKSESLMRQDSADKRKMSWASLVSNVVVSEKVKNILAFRKKSAGRKNNKQSVTERVLAFVQSRVAVEQLEQVSKLRTNRAGLRARGIIMLAQSLESSGFPNSLCWILYSFAAAMRHNPHTESAITHRVHYGFNVEGSIPKVHDSLTSAFGEFFDRILSILEVAKDKSKNVEVNEFERSAWDKTIVACIRALAMDYQENDHPFLEKSHILSHILDFAVWPNLEIREASQALLEVLVDRCVAGNNRAPVDNSEINEPTPFTLKLIEHVSGKVNQFSTDLTKSTALASIPALPPASKCLVPQVLNLHPDKVESGFSHPHINVGLTHTFSFWIRRPSTPSIDGVAQIRAGSCVVPVSSSEGGPEAIGTVTSIDSVGRVSVKWDNGSVSLVHPDNIDNELHLADKTVSGRIITKGLPALFSDEVARKNCPKWALFGVEMHCDGSIGYYVSIGLGLQRNKTKEKLPADEWFHVVVTQQYQLNTIYINGLESSVQTFDEKLLSSSTTLVLESEHPYPHNLDVYYDLNFPGANNVTVTFDEQTRTEAGCDYVKFYKNQSRSEMWGETYSGRDSNRNFPGLDGKASLVIPSSSFVFYYHSDGSNNDWGYKVTIEPDEVNPEMQFSAENLNNYPFYFGNGPIYSSSFPSFNGEFAMFTVFPTALSAEEVGALTSDQSALESLNRVDNANGISALSLLLRGLNSVAKQISLNNTLEKSISSPAVVKSLFSIIRFGAPLTQVAAYRILAKVLPKLEVEVVNNIFHSTAPAAIANGDGQDSFIHYLFSSAGNSFFLLSQQSEDDCKLIRSPESMFAIAVNMISLLRSMATAGKPVEEDGVRSGLSLSWRSAICEVMQQIVQSSVSSIRSLEDNRYNQGLNTSFTDLYPLVGVLAFAGGVLPGVYPGAQCSYLNEKGLAEACTVISSAPKPEYDPVSEKDLYKKWKDVEQYGEAVVIVLNAEPDKPLTVERKSLSVPKSDTDVELSDVLNDYFGSDDAASTVLFGILRNVVMLDTVDIRPVLEPIVTEKEVELVFESSHPYSDGLDVYTNVTIPGSEKLTIKFSSESRIEHGCDYVRLYKDSRRSDTWAADYTGRDGSQNYCGCEDRPPLEIPSDSFVLYFHTDSSGNDWGYQFTVTGVEKKVIEPPDLPPLPNLLVLRFLKMMGLKSLASVSGTCDYFAKETLHFSQKVVESALAPIPPQSSGSMKPVIIESKHPYDNSMDEYQSYTFPGAKRLSISFDPMSQTENGCDYLRLYTDSTHTNIIPGADQFTGGLNGSNSTFPGFGDRPPLVVEGNAFETYFHSDGSVNAWGYKMIVTPIGGGGASSSPMVCANPDLSALQYFYMWELAKDSVFDGRVQESIDYTAFPSKPASKFCASYVSINELSGGAEESKDNDEARVEDITVAITKSHTFKVNSGTQAVWPKGYSVTESYTGAIQFHVDSGAESDVSATIPECSKHNSLFLATEARGEWLYVRRLAQPKLESTATEAEGEGEGQVESETFSPEGWVRMRENDDIILVRNDSVPGCVPEMVVIPSHYTIAATKKAESASAPSSSTSTSQSSKHPMYSIDDSSSTLANPNDSGIDAMDVLRTAKAKGMSKLASFAEECCVGYSHVVIAKWLSRWPTDIPFDVEPFGGLSGFLSYLLLTFSSEEKLYVDALTNLKQLLMKSLKSGNMQANILCKNLVAYAKSQLASNQEMCKIAPVSRGYSRVVESRHPYECNLDQEYSVTLPGSKYLLLVFDDRSATETNCDYLVVKDSNGNEIGPRLTGAKDSSDRNWPGAGDRPPLRIPGEEVMMTFHSDGGVVDWGFKVTVYGIIEEPPEEEIKEYTDYVAKLANSSFKPEFACWILSMLAREHSVAIDKALFSSDTLRSVIDYFSVVDAEKKPEPLQLLSSLLQGIQKLNSLSFESLAEVLRLRESLIQTSTELYRNDTSNGSDTTKVSRLLQLCVQVITIIDSLLISNANGGGAGASSGLVKTSSRSLQAALPEGLVALEGDDNAVLNTVDQKGLMRWLPEGLADNLELANSRRILRRKPHSGDEGGVDTYSTAIGKYGFESGKQSFNVKVLGYSNGEPIIGVAMLPVSPALQLGSTPEQFEIGWGNQKLYVKGYEPVSFGPIIRPGDIISVTIDVGKGLVTFYRNSALVGLAVGPANSGAFIETHIGSGPFYPAVSLRNSGDSVEFANVPFGNEKSSSVSSGDMERSSIVPDWMRPVKESVSVMKSFLQREVPPNILTAQFLPACMRKSSVNVQLSSASSSLDIHIPEASAVSVFIKESTLQSEESLRITADNGTVLFDKNSLEANAPSDILAAAIKLFGGSVSTDSKPEIEIGSLVVRGPSWCYGDADGGIGSIGTVSEITDWKGENECGIVVNWTVNGAQSSGLYRWNYFGERDIQVFKISESQESAVKAQNATSIGFVLPGNKFHLEIPSTSGSSVSLVIVPKVTLSSAVDCSLYQPLLAHFRAQYVGNGSLLSDFALVRHIDNRSKSLGLSINSLLTSKWDSLKPSETELSKSAALQALVNSEGLPFPEGFEEIKVNATSDKTVYNIHMVQSTGRYSYEQYAAFAARLGGSLPTKEELEAKFSIFYPLLQQIEGPQYWPTSGGANEWVVMHFDEDDESEQEQGLQFGIPDFEEDTYSPNRVTFGVKLPECAGGRVCEGCGEDTVPSTHAYSGGEFGCDSCGTGVACSDGRWFCCSCYKDYCYSCCPLQLNDVARSASFADALDNDNLTPLHGCIVNGIRADCDIDFDTLIDAVGCNAILENPCTAVVFMPSTGKFYLRDGEVVPNAEGCVVFKTVLSAAAVADKPKSSETIVREQPVEARFSIIRSLNGDLGKALPLIDLTAVDVPGSVASLLSVCRGLIFDSVKYPLWENALNATAGSGGQFELRLSRSRARKFAASGQVDHDGRFMVFSQAFRQIHPMATNTIRRGDKLYTTQFMGERAHDAGGPYRESFAMYTQELQSKSLPLLLPTPNGRHAAGFNRDKWVLNPSSKSATHLEMFAFFGKLMGIAIRSKEYLALSLPSIIWKLLVNEVVTTEDLEAIDISIVNSMNSIRNIDQEGIDEETFAMTFFETFTTTTTDDRIVDLIPGGSSIDLTFANRAEYCDLVLKYRMHEFDEQAAAIRKGLATMVPISLLSLFSWSQLETMVCGNPEIDVKLLESITEYSGCNSTDGHVRLFWQALEEFDNEERSALVRFTWGRSRLPLTAAAFNQRFKLQGFNKSPADSYLPVAHTCFFSLELPAYSSLEVMKNKLRYAIFNCEAIDGDDTSTGMAVAAMGWEE